VVDLEIDSLLMGNAVGQSPLAQSQQLGAQRPNGTTPMQPSFGQPQGSPASRLMQMPDLSSGNNASSSNTSNNGQLLAQMQQANASAANLMAGLAVNASTIPRAATLAGLTLQTQKSMPISMFDGLNRAMSSRKGIDTSIRYVEGQKVEPYHLFLIVCKFGGHAEVSRQAFSLYATRQRLTVGLYRYRQRISGA
jgi:hypothetical protein